MAGIYWSPLPGLLQAAAPSHPALHESGSQGVGNKDQMSTFDIYFLKKGFFQYPKWSSNVSQSVQIQCISNWVTWTRAQIYEDI